MAGKKGLRATYAFKSFYQYANSLIGILKASLDSSDMIIEGTSGKYIQQLPLALSTWERIKDSGR